MNFGLRRHLGILTGSAVLYMSVFSQCALAQDHVVPITELQRDAESAAKSRTTNLTDIERVLSLPAAQDAMRKANVNLEQAKSAVSLLSSDELARLADRARAAEKDVEGGLIFGLLALIGLIVVIIIVVAIVAQNDDRQLHGETAV
jgi:hypothetical protein